VGALGDVGVLKVQRSGEFKGSDDVGRSPKAVRAKKAKATREAGLQATGRSEAACAHEGAVAGTDDGVTDP
jgi:hypothetical protein